MKSILLFALATLSTATAASKSYENFKLYEVLCVTSSDVEALIVWERNPLIDFWALPGVNKSAAVLVAPSLVKDFEDFLSDENFNYEILIENVGQWVESWFFFAVCRFEKSSKYFSAFYFYFRTFESHRRSALKFHFQNRNFSETVRDFSHYWTLPEVGKCP